MSSPEAPFGRLLTAMATAFNDDGSVDLEGTAKIASHLMDNGHDGVVVSGTTGESSTTTTIEDGEILAAVKDAVGGRGSVIAGVGTNSTPHSIELAKQAEKIGVDSLLLVTPYYNKPSQRGILHHFREVAQAAEVPVMLYDVPGRSGVSIAPETYAAAIQVDNITTVKHATGDPTATVMLNQLGYSVYSGDDALILGYLVHGACGLISVPGHAVGPQLKQLIDAFVSGDHAAALATYADLVPVFNAVMGVPNYGATTAKGLLQLLGVLDNRNVRGPLVPLDDVEYAALDAALQAANLI